MRGHRATVSLIQGIACGLLIGAHSQVSSAQTCPPNCLPAAGCSTAPSGSSYVSDPHGPGGVMSGGYSLPLGQLYCSGVRTVSIVQTSDWFVVEQAPSSLPFTLAIEMDFYAGLEESMAMGRLSIPGKGELEQPCVTQCHETPSLDFSVALGDTFTVNALCHGESVAEFGTYSVTLDYALRNVPPGVVIRSCQGYVVDTATPTRAVSWGRIKRHYR